MSRKPAKARRTTRNRLTPELAAKIREARRAGASYEVLAKRFSVSQGTIANALKGGSGAVAAPANVSTAPEGTAPEGDTTPEPPSQDDVRRWLGEQVSGLRADVARCRASGDMPGAAAASRALVTATALLARVTPEPEAEQDGIWVSLASMHEAKERARAELHRLVDALATRRYLPGQPPPTAAAEPK